VRRLFVLFTAGAILGACSRELGADPSGASSASGEHGEDPNPPLPPARPQSLSSGGRVVADPVPPPPPCPGLSTTIRATARWNDANAIELRLSEPGMARASFNGFSRASLHPNTSKLVKESITAKSVELDIDPGVNSAVVVATIVVACPEGAQRVSVAITGPNQALLKRGVPLTVALRDLAGS
jgi:hypothetical protein